GRARGCEVIVTGGGGDEWLSVGPFYMADLLRAGNLPGAYRFLRALTRSYDLPRLALARFALWVAGIRPLLALGARGILRPLAPGLMRALWRRRAGRLVHGWLAPDAALRRQIAEHLDEGVEGRMREPEPSGPYGFYMRGALANFVHPLASMDHEEAHE